MEGLFGDLERPVDWVLMLYAYCDESGHEQQEHYMFLAGFFGNREQWDRLRVKWPEAGGTPGFHTAKVLRNAKRAEPKLARLATVPGMCGLRPIIGGVRAKDYWDLVSGSSDRKRAKGWCACLYPLVLDTLLRVPKNETVKFVFEEQAEYQQYAMHVMRAIQKYDDPRLRTTEGATKLHSFMFVPKENCLFTQPADYLAHAVFSFYRDPASESARLTKPMLDCIGPFKEIGEIMSRKKIRTILENMPSLGVRKKR